MLTIDSHFIRAVLRKASSKGVSAQALLDECGISSEVYRQPQGHVHVDQFVSLIQRASVMFDDEYLGLGGARCQPGHFALMVRYTRQFSTLEILLEEICLFYKITREDTRFTIIINEDEVQLSIELISSEQDVDHFLLEYMMVSIHRFLCWVSGQHIVLKRMSFCYPEPDHSDSYKYFFSCPQKFNQSNNVMVFNRKFLSLPLVRNHAELKAFLKKAPADLMVMPSIDKSLSTKLKGILLEHYRRGEGFPDFSHIATALNMGPQTLRRKLKLENASYNEIKDAIRRDLAIDKLVHENMPVADIGLQLGFVEPASFTRAFKQWTGVSPAKYRSSLKS